MIYTLFNDSITWYLFMIVKVEAYIFYDLLSIVELAVFFMFVNIIIKDRRIVKYLPFAFAGFIVFSLFDYFVLRKDKSFNSTITCIEAIIIITLCVYYFYIQLNEAGTSIIYATQNFWLIIAFLIYFSGTFFLYIYAENTLHDKVFQIQYIFINSSFTLMKNIFFSIAFLIKPEKQEQSHFPNDNLISDWNIHSMENVN